MVELHQRANALRRNMTDAERCLWWRLRNRQLNGAYFRRQQPIGRYIVDFVCFERGLVIELDGGQHATAVAADQQRDAWLATQGLRVLRFWDPEVLQNTDGVLETILASGIDITFWPWLLRFGRDWPG